MKHTLLTLTILSFISISYAESIPNPDDVVQRAMSGFNEMVKELERLRKENSELRQERDSLKAQLQKKVNLPDDSTTLSSFSEQLEKLEATHNEMAKTLSEWGEKTQNQYSDKIKEHRVEFKKNMKQNQWFPFKTDSEFAGINFFPADSGYRVVAKYEPLEQVSSEDTMKSSGGGEDNFFRKSGVVSFQKGEEEFTLSVYKRLLPPGSEFEDMNFHFIPFLDETNGISTYGGGRYLEFDVSLIGSDASVELDFNKAYNPWCHYSPDMPCPLPPELNRLSISIPAGEKAYAKSVATN